MTHREALIQILPIVSTIPGDCMGDRAEAIWLIVEQLADPDVHFSGAPPTGDLDRS